MGLFKNLFGNSSISAEQQVNSLNDIFREEENNIRNKFFKKEKELNNQKDNEISKVVSEHETNKNKLEKEYKKIFDKKKVGFEKEQLRLNKEYQEWYRDINSRLLKTQNFFNTHYETSQGNNKLWKDLKEMEEHLSLPYINAGQSKFSAKSLDDKNIDIYLPTLIPFLNRSNILFKCDEKRIKDAVLILHTIIARILMSLPAGKVKFIFIDPVGLGANVSPFLALNENLYGSKVWVESNHIEEQLFGLSRHMENVIQKYLQDNYKNIASYNIDADEVEEAYRILIVINFPEAITDSAANKLKSIMQNGPKTGVNTILIANNNKPMPHGFKLSELENLATVVDLDVKLNKIGLEYLNSVKQIDFTNGKNLQINHIAKFINEGLTKLETVRVPFQKHLQEKKDWWTKKSGKNFEVSIGRSGAKGIQVLEFNNETTPHALLVGIPGSGKSNLLHTLITDCITTYHPDDIELYLIDFKGGVEFNLYADKKIPHARTIAIESEREFGLSVIEGLEKELLTRETLFRDKKTRALDEFNQKYPDDRMPRIILIVDEFQEFFTEEDPIKSKAEKIFDRIVRKGRAFGINVLLSTQSLAGISLPRSTKDLIAIRIALMCSDNDSRLILADDNSAAKYLTRPGEGIYNSASGLVEGNNRFQTFFMEKKDFEFVNQRLVDLLKTNNWQRKQKLIIFKGSDPSYLEANESIIKIIPEAKPKRMNVWVGEPVSIAEDVFTTLRRQSGSNLLVVGTDEDTALRIIISSLLSIIAHHKRETAKFYFLNFINIDSDLYSKPKEYFESIPFSTHFGTNRDVKQYLLKIKSEIEKRLENDELIEGNIYLTILALQRGRSLRKDGYSLSEEGELLSSVLKDGPDVGVFTIMYVDLLNNLEKTFDYKVLNEFSQRIALQMSADDSRNLLDCDSASKLSLNRAFYYDEVECILQKFRPYTLPNLTWVENKVINKLNNP